MSLAPAAYLLFQKVMRRDPKDHSWLGRDRFILSAGHSSLTQYVQLYLGGEGLELDDLKALRTWGSKTPGHPEYGHTAGVEITTGPLGQGLASAVGFAYAARYERGLFDPEAAAGTSPFDHFVYVVAGDGDIQEGVTAESAPLAGHQKLGNLIAIYDSNQISIEDDTQIAFSEDVAEGVGVDQEGAALARPDLLVGLSRLRRASRGDEAVDEQPAQGSGEVDHARIAQKLPQESTDRAGFGCQGGAQVDEQGSCLRGVRGRHGCAG